jgi:hypothetical protein
MAQQNINDQPTGDLAKMKRPLAITIICIISFIGAVFIIPVIFSDLAKQVGSWYPPYLAFSTIVSFACMVGLWQLKKWAAYTYTGLVVLNQIVLQTMGVWNIMSLIIPAIVIVVALAYVKILD